MVWEVNDEKSISKIITVVVANNGEIANFFTDVPYIESGPNTLYAAIHYLALNGIVIGYDNGAGGRMFRPDAQVNQAEALKMFMLAAHKIGIIELDAAKRYLPNLIIEMMDNENYYYRNYTWAAPFVLKAEELGIIEDAGAFDPEASLTREWAAGVVCGLLGFESPDELKGADYLFTDRTSFTSIIGYDAARTAALFGYFTGLGSSFNPATAMTRSDLAVLAAKILRTPQFDNINTNGLTEQTVADCLLPAVNLGSSFTITGLADVSHYKILQTLATIKHEWIDTPEEYLNIAVFRQGETNGAISLLQNLDTNPITIATGDLTIHNEQIRSLLVVLKDPYSGVSAVKHLEYGILFPDQDNDGIHDNEDLWPNDSRFHSDANNNNIPDIADSIWDMDEVQGDTVLPYGNGTTTYIDALLAGNFTAIDTDGDGINDTTDPDDDNDGIPDSEDSYPLNPYTVTFIAGAHGSITPAGTQIVNLGDTVTFTITPDQNYHIDSVTGCDLTQIDNSTYITAPISGNCEVNVSFSMMYDVNGDNIVNLADTILALQVVCGAATSGINLAADINNDGRIGIEEALKVFSLLAEGDIN